MMRDATTHAAEIGSRGFTVLPGVYGPEHVAALRSSLQRTYDAAGRPSLVGSGHIVEKDSDVAVTSTGFVVRRILDACPEVAPLLLVQPAADVLRAFLGDGAHLELAGAVISDAARPFFKWHNHVGGIDDRYWEGRRDYPLTLADRVLMLVYLDAVSPEGGSLLVYPRDRDAPLEAPFPLEQQRWPGQEELAAPVGSVVLLEQATWHAALPQRRPGLRMFLGLYFARAGAPTPEHADETLVGRHTGIPLLDGMLPPGP